MKRSKVYKCPITAYMVEYYIDNDNEVAETGSFITDYQNMKSFLALLRSSVEQLKRDEGVTHIIQTVGNDEWTTYLKDKTSWQIIKIDPKYRLCTIKCSIDDYLENYGVAIGLQDISSTIVI